MDLSDMTGVYRSIEKVENLRLGLGDRMIINNFCGGESLMEGDNICSVEDYLIKFGYEIRAIKPNNL